jgi:hypothetical protein
MSTRDGNSSLRVGLESHWSRKENDLRLDLDSWLIDLRLDLDVRNSWTMQVSTGQVSVCCAFCQITWSRRHCNRESSLIQRAEKCSRTSAFCKKYADDDISISFGEKTESVSVTVDILTDRTMRGLHGSNSHYMAMEWKKLSSVELW